MLHHFVLMVFHQKPCMRNLREKQKEENEYNMNDQRITNGLSHRILLRLNLVNLNDVSYPFDEPNSRIQMLVEILSISNFFLQITLLHLFDS
jgi:hypothetical protein